ncbi:MAG TPA: DUF1015 domain-containing protein, partial [Mycobacteriales bacterium]|nr:DUF1015 domain-containing protein [Mycobacteriales bacterium]
MLAPFRALRPDPAVTGGLADLTSPPYDVLDDGTVADLEAASAWNVVHLILPRPDPDAGHDRFAAAAARLRSWRDTGALRPDPVPALYVYEEAAPNGHVQRGLVGALQLSPAEDGIVLPHEDTMAGPVADRLALYTAVGADLEPILLVTDGGGAASRAVAEADAAPPLVDVVLPDGLRHRLWALTDPDLLAAVADDLHPRTALIADGHHRYATYLQRQARHHAAGDGPGPWDYGLCLLVDSGRHGPDVHAIHRVVPGVPAATLVERAAGRARVRPLDLPSGSGPTEVLQALAGARAGGPAFVLVDGGTGARFLLSDLDPDLVAATLPGDRSAAWRSLDVTVLHHVVVPHLWSLRDDEHAVAFEHDADSAVRRAATTGGTAVL